MGSRMILPLVEKKLKKKSLKESVIGNRKAVSVRFSSAKGGGGVGEKGSGVGGGVGVTQQSIQFSPGRSAPSFKP